MHIRIKKLTPPKVTYHLLKYSQEICFNPLELPHFKTHFHHASIINVKLKAHTNAKSMCRSTACVNWNLPIPNSIFRTHQETSWQSQL